MRFKERLRGRPAPPATRWGRIWKPRTAAGVKGSRTPQPACFKSAKRTQIIRLVEVTTEKAQYLDLEKVMAAAFSVD